MKRYMLLAAVVLAGIIPFSSRAVFMDEHIFLQIAQSAQIHWFFPQDTPGMFFGAPVANARVHGATSSAMRPSRRARGKKAGSADSGSCEAGNSSFPAARTSLPARSDGGSATSAHALCDVEACPLV